MFQLRRSAQRLLSNPSTSFYVHSRSITSISRPAFNITRQTTFAPTFQRRWASEEVKQDEEKSAGEVSGAAPVEKVEPSPQAEAENAVQQQDSNPAKTSAEAPSTVGSLLDSATETVKNAASTVQSTFGNEAPQSDTLYVGNLFFDVSEQDLTNEFSRFGKISNVNLIRDGRGLSRGFGYVGFVNSEDASKAKEAMNQTIFEGRRITAQFAQRRINTRPNNSSLNPPSKTLFIGNMSFEMTDRDLNSLFKGIRNVIDVRVAIDRRTGQPRGFAHADFLDTKSAIEAQNILKDKEIFGRRLRVDFSQTSRNTNRGRDSGEAPQQ